MNEDNLMALQPASASAVFNDALSELVRQGARQIIAQAVEAELNQFLVQYQDIKDEQGRQAVVPNGYLPQRTIVTGIGEVPANRLSFAIWVASVSRMPELLADVSTGLQPGYKCPISVNKLSDYFNGHRLMRSSSRVLLKRCLVELTGADGSKSLLIPGELKPQSRPAKSAGLPQTSGG